jgi:hypothetical protein
MSDTLVIGLLGTFVPLFTVGYLMLNKQAGVFRMFVAMLLVGLGYLTATGAMEDIGARILGKSNGVAVPAAATAPAPAADKAAAPAPAAEKAPAPAPEAPKADAPADGKPAGAY